MNEEYRQRERRNDDNLPVNNNLLTNKRDTIDRRGMTTCRVYNKYLDHKTRDAKTLSKKQLKNY